MRTRPTLAVPTRHPTAAPRPVVKQRVASIAAVLGVLTIALATPPPVDAFEKVYAARARLVCRIPASGNPQRVIGFDGASSFVQGNTAFWSTGDVLIDGNGDGFYHGADEPLGFRTGSIGRASTRRPDKCVDLTLRNTGGTVLPALVPDPAANECLFWPNEIFEADGKLYFFFGIQYEYPSCHLEEPTVGYGIGLGRLTNPGSSDLGPVREGTDGGWSYYLSPLKVGGFVYTFRYGANVGLYAARVDEKHVASRGRYEYWTGPGTRWGGATNAVPLAQMEAVDGAPRIAFNDYVGRFMMIYACDSFRAICARTAKLPGQTAAALESGFNDKTVLLDHPASFYTSWHAGYRDPAHPERIYLTTARQPGYRTYYATWWELDLSATPPPATRTFYYGGRDLYRDGPGTGAWNYGTYDVAAPGAGLSVGTLVPGIGPAHPDPKVAPLLGYVGNESVAGVSAPGAAPTSVWPSETRGGAIVWTAPASGSIEISAALWLESTRGDNGFADIVLVRGSSVLPIWSKRMVAKWKKTRQRRIQRRDIQVRTGDRIVFGARKGRNATASALHDLTFIDVTITLDRR